MQTLWSESSKYSYWGAVERAHLETLVSRGIAPTESIAAFDSAVSKKTAESFLAREQETGHDVIAYISEVADAMGPTGCHLHRGLTSSDVVDTALALRMKAALDLVVDALAETRQELCEQAFRHANTLCIGRTHGIHAEPTSFGLVLASHFSEFQRAHNELLGAIEQASFAKLSGAVGNYTQLTADFEADVLNKLGLKVEPVSTQVVPRDRHARVARALVSVAQAVDRFATNLRHWARTELGEVLEPFSAKQKGSSAMPHKRNPILAENLCGLARTAYGYAHALEANVPLWHERDISHSSVERLALPDLFAVVDFMSARTASVVKNMQVRPDVMRANLAKTGGLWASQSVLTKLVDAAMPRTEAYEAIQSAALPLAEKMATTALSPTAFLDALSANSVVTRRVSAESLAALFAPERFLASVPLVFKRTFGIAPEDFAANRADGTRLAAVVPALQTVYRVTVELLPDVLDTEAKTIANDLAHQKVSVASLRQQKIFVVRTPDRLQRDAIRTYAAEVLHNPVMERFNVEVVQ
jgi:adenylosuccinate lyase